MASDEKHPPPAVFSSSDEPQASGSGGSQSKNDKDAMKHVVMAHHSQNDLPPPYTPHATSSAQVAPMTDTRPEPRSSSKSACSRKCCLPVAIVIILVVLAVGAVCLWYFKFRAPKVHEPKITGGIQTAAFYSNVASLRIKISFNFVFPAGILANMNGKEKLAIIFLRNEKGSGNELFQVAMVSLINTPSNLLAVITAASRYMVKATTTVDFYFPKYPVNLHLEIALGAYDQQKFLWGGSAYGIFDFKSKDDAPVTVDLDIGSPHLPADAIVANIVKEAGWTGGVVAADSKSRGKIKTGTTPRCNTHYFLKDCSRFCAPKNSSAGHYSCAADGSKKCLHGWRNVNNNCLDVDHCASVTCWHGGTCQNVNNSFVCYCQSGYNGTYCELDINECLNGTPCLNGGTCQNTNGSFNCLCPATFQGSRCANDVNECQQTPGLCKNGGTCNNTVGGYQCRCTAHFTGRNCETPINRTLASTFSPSMVLLLSAMLFLLLFR